MAARYDVAPATEPGELCDKLGVNMSRAQWREWISPTLEYRVVCPICAVACAMVDETGHETLG